MLTARRVNRDVPLNRAPAHRRSAGLGKEATGGTKSTNSGWLKHLMRKMSLTPLLTDPFVDPIKYDGIYPDAIYSEF